MSIWRHRDSRGCCDTSDTCAVWDKRNDDMKLFGLEIRRAGKAELSDVTAYGGWNGIQLASRSNSMLLSTVYRCVDLISDTIAMLPVKIYSVDGDGYKKEAKSHPLWYLLDYEPAENTDRFTLMKVLTASALLQGNGYAYIERDADGIKPVQVRFLDAHQVQVCYIKDSDGVQHLRYLVVGLKELVEPCDMLHIKNFSYDGVVGVSTLTHARQTLDISTANEEATANYFSAGQKVTGVLTCEGARPTEEQVKDIYKRWEEHTRKQGGLQVIPASMKYQAISINPKDSQMLESRQFQVIDICRFFSVSPVKAFDLSKSSYSTVEATQLQFLTDTAMAWISRFEQELNRKLLTPSERGKYIIELDTTVLLRTDKKAQAEYWREMFNVGAATPNEIRQKSNLPRIDGGDDAFVQVNVQPLKKAAAGKVDKSVGQGNG